MIDRRRNFAQINLNFSNENSFAEKPFLDKYALDPSTLSLNPISDKLDLSSHATVRMVNQKDSFMITDESYQSVSDINDSTSSEHSDYIFGENVSGDLSGPVEGNGHETFTQKIEVIYRHAIPTGGQILTYINDQLYKFIVNNIERLNSAIIYERDSLFDSYRLEVLQRIYLIKINGSVFERPQDMFMRVAAAINLGDVEATIDTYNLLSEGFYVHSPPTLCNIGSDNDYLSSSFLIAMSDDSISGIFDTVKNCASIYNYDGSIGLHVHNIRVQGSFIAGTSGTSNGLVPMLKVFNSVEKYTKREEDCRRSNSFTVFLEPWHSDVFPFLDLKKNTGSEELRSRNLSYALWIPDLFMKRVEQNEDWSLMCPNACRGLSDVYGDEFDALYTKYESEGKFTKKVKAQKLWFAIIESQMETGEPFLIYKDACNQKSNQKNIGVIKSTSSETDIVHYSDDKETAAVNTCSISLPKFVKFSKTNNPYYDFDQLHSVTKSITVNMNRIIDTSTYPTSCSKASSHKHRSMGIGVEGLADVFILMRYPYDSPEAKSLNISIFETIYHASLESSCEEAHKYGSYSSFEGSPASQGILQYDMWKITPSSLWDWDLLKENIKKYGLRNSLLTACGNTTLTSQLLGTNPSTDPYMSYVYSQKILSSNFQYVNSHLIKDLHELNLWSENMKNKIIADNGSIQNIDEIPDHLKLLYRTAWELSMKTIMNLTVDRAAFIDQSQSLNLFISDATTSKLTSMHFHAWKMGLKTGLHHLRPQKSFSTAKAEIQSPIVVKNNAKPICNETGDACMMCSA